MNMTNSDLPSQAAALWAPRYAGRFAVVIGCLVLFGWIFEIEALKSLVGGLASMKANAAIGMILLGLAIAEIASPTDKPPHARISTILAASVFLLGLATLLQDLFDWQFGIDQLLIRELADSAFTGHAGRMSPFTAICFVILGAAVICWQYHRHTWTQSLALLPLPLLLLPLSGYLFGDPAFPRLGNFSVIAAHSAVTFLMLSAALVYATNDVGLLAKLGDRNEKIVFNGSVLLLIVCGLASGVNALRLAQHNAWLIQSYRQSQLLDNVELAVNQVLAARRGIFLTNDNRYLADFNHALDNLGNDFEHANQLSQQLSKRSPALAQLLTTLSSQLQTLLSNATTTDSRPTSQAQLAIIQTDRQLADQIHNLVNSAQRMVNDRQSQQQHNIRLADSSTMVSLLVTWLVGLTLVLASRNKLKKEILKRKQSETALAESLAHSQILVDSAQDAVVCINDQGRISHWNLQAEKIFGFSKEQALGCEPTELIVPPNLRQSYRQGIRRFLETSTPEIVGKHFEVQAMAANGSEFPMELSLSACKIDGRDFFIGYARDIRDRKLIQQQLWHQANYDRLTDLPKRPLFFDRLSRAISHARRCNGYVGVLFLDLDGFKQANDQFGHHAGDVVLQTVTKRWQRCLRASDTLARIGGDEFAVIVANLEAREVAALIADKLIESLRQRIDLPSHNDCLVGVSIGIAIYPEHATEMDSLLSAADSAMYQSKSGGKNTFRFSNAVADQANHGLHWLQFDDSHLIGVAEIDDQHRHLVRLVNQLNHAVVHRSANEDNNRLLQKIIEFAVFHFETEHRLMEAYRYPNIEQHDQEHGALTNDIQSFAEEFRQGNEVILLQFLKDWLLNHILNSDMALGEFINSHASPADSR